MATGPTIELWFPDDNYTQKGMEVCGEADRMMMAFMRKWADQGVSVRHLASVMHAAVSLAECGASLRKRFK